MAKATQIIEGMQILLKYYNKPDGYHTAAEHDSIHMLGTDMPVSEEDQAKLKQLKWFQTEAELDADENPIYDVDSDWQTYV